MVLAFGWCKSLRTEVCSLYGPILGHDQAQVSVAVYSVSEKVDGKFIFPQVTISRQRNVFILLDSGVIYIMASTIQQVFFVDVSL